MCEAHAASYENAEQGFTCCMIHTHEDGTHEFSVHKGSRMRWTGMCKALVLPAKQFTADAETYEGAVIPYNAPEPETPHDDTSERPPWNNGYRCSGPAIADEFAAKLQLDNVIDKKWHNGDRQGKNKELKAAGCMRYCEEKNKNIKKLKGEMREGFHLTCCQWDHENETCDFRLGAETEWTGRTTSIFFAPGAKLLEEEGTGYEGKDAQPEPEPTPAPAPAPAPADDKMKLTKVTKLMKEMTELKVMKIKEVMNDHYSEFLKTFLKRNSNLLL